MVQALPKSRLAPGDLIRTAIVGIRMRKLRSALSSLGIVIGVAAMVGILGLAESSKSELLAQLDRLGTNLLIVESGTGFGLGTGALPTEATGMIARIGPVESTSMISFVGGGVYTNDRIPEGRTGGISIQAVDTGLLDVLAGSVADGVWLGDAKASYRTVVLGSVAARRLGVREVTGTQPIWLGGRWFTVIGVLNTFELSPDLDRSALIGHAAAATFLDHENLPTRVLARVDPAIQVPRYGAVSSNGPGDAESYAQACRPRKMCCQLAPGQLSGSGGEHKGGRQRQQVCGYHLRGSPSSSWRDSSPAAFCKAATSNPTSPVRAASRATKNTPSRPTRVSMATIAPSTPSCPPMTEATRWRRMIAVPRPRATSQAERISVRICAVIRVRPPRTYGRQRSNRG